MELAHDGLPINLYIVNIGYVDKIEYSSGKYWYNKYTVYIRIFINLCDAIDYFKSMKNKIVGKRFMQLYNYLSDGSKDYLYTTYGCLAYKDSRY